MRLCDHPEIYGLPPYVLRVVLDLLDGRTAPEIADRHGLSLSAVYSYRAKACTLLGPDSEIVRAMPVLRRGRPPKSGSRTTSWGSLDDTRIVGLYTTPGPDGHDHVAVFDSETGDGETTPGPDGHTHTVRMLDVLTTQGHAHDITSRRAPRI